MAALADSRTGSVRVAVGIVAGHRPALLHTTIDSVRAQSVSEWELFVLDDGADPQVAAVVDAFGDARIRRVPVERPGTAAALRTLLGLGEAPFVALLNAGDELRADHLRRTCTLLEAYPRAVVAHCAFEIAAPDGGVRPVVLAGSGRPFEESGRVFRRRAVAGAPRIWLGAALWRRRSLLGIDPAAGAGDDLSFYLRASCRGSVTYDPVATAVWSPRHGTVAADGFVTVDDGGSAATLTTAERRLQACRARPGDSPFGRRDRAELHLAAHLAAHRLLVAVLQRRWQEEPTLGERVAVTRRALATDRTLAADPLAWWQLLRTARSTVVPGARPEGDRCTAAPPSGPTVEGGAGPVVTPPAPTPLTRSAWAQARLDAEAAEAAAIAVAERVLLTPQP